MVVTVQPSRSSQTRKPLKKLKQIEVVDKLDYDSSGRSIRHKIILPRKYGLEGIKEIKDLLSEKESNIKLKMLIGTIYHELWNVSTWHKYKAMYEYVLDETYVLKTLKNRYFLIWTIFES